MQKTLTPLGNSLALVIEKPVRALLGISRQTILQISTDGRRLIVEPLGPVIEADPKRVLMVLMDHHGMTFPELLPLWEGVVRLGECMARLLTPKHDRTPALQRSIDRMVECLRQLKAGRTREQAVAAALAVSPKPA